MPPASSRSTSSPDAPDDRAQHPRPPVSRAAAAAGARPHWLLRPWHVQRIELIREMQSQGSTWRRSAAFEAAPNAGDEPRASCRRCTGCTWREADPDRRPARRALAHQGPCCSRARSAWALRPLEDGTYGPQPAARPRRRRAGGDLGVLMDIQLGWPPRSRARRRDRAGLRPALPSTSAVQSRCAGRVLAWVPGARAAASAGAESVLAVFALAMRDATEEAFGRERERIKQHRDPAAR